MNFKKRTILPNNNTGGQGSRHGSHLATKAQFHALNQVLCMTTDRKELATYSSNYFPTTCQLGGSSEETEFYMAVMEVPPQGYSGALHDNSAPLQSDVDTFRNVDSLTAENGFRSFSQ